MGTTLYGSEIVKDMRASLKEQIDELREKGEGILKLVMILVGDNPASLSYVTGKEKTCGEIGMENVPLRPQEDTAEEALLTEIHRLSTDASVDGTLVQLPLPKHMDEHRALFTINSLKDVDDFHPYNIGKLILQEDTHLSCVLKGILRMLDTVGYSDLSGPRAVVTDCSNIAGKPVAQLLLSRNATVTIHHSRTGNIEEICAEADILIASVGNSCLITVNWVKKGTAVIDAGISRVGGRLCDDVDFETVEDKVAVITPTPKGVGPMTIVMLLESMLESYRKHG